jgi:hypothetical protein
MSTPDDRAALERARRDLAAARSDAARRALAAARAEAALADAKRVFGSDDDRTFEAIRARDEAKKRLDGARGLIRNAESTLTGAINEFIRDVPEQDFSRLDASLPIVMLPVRLETRFQRGRQMAELLIRVYPDEIVADPHEPALTEVERALGEAYWRGVWSVPERRLDEWRKLLAGNPPTRAAWIVHATTPTNVDTTPPPEAPEFPEPELKAEQWTRAVEARVLPDRWIALGYRGGTEVARAVSSAILEPLVLSLGPDLDEATAIDISGDGLTLDPALVWTVDFARAEAAGMAIRMPLTQDLAATGLDQLFVVGVKSSLGPEESAERFAELLDAHHYSRGLAFVPQGTPTNNTRAAAAGFPPRDADGTKSFATELGLPLAMPESDGARVAQAFGVPAAVFDHIEGANRDEQSAAGAMADALWPATWGYFLEQLLDIDEDDANFDSFRSYFADHVRARGHFPAFRVGGTPYGLLVASSLERWQQRGDRRSFESRLPAELKRLLPIWASQLHRVPRTGESTDPDGDLVKVLEMDASTREVRVRRVLGPDASFNLLALLAIDWTNWGSERVRLALEVARLLGRNEVASRLFAVSYDNLSFPFSGGFVIDRLQDGHEPLSETAGLDPNYIEWLRKASLEDLRNNNFPGSSPPRALLYLLLRHALLRQIGDAGDRLLVVAQLFPKSAKREAELVGMQVTGVAAEGVAARQPVPSTVWERLERPIPNVTGRLPLSRWLLEVEGQPGTQSIEAYRANLETLEDLSTAELERLLTETLDVCSHRLDPWITSLYAERLREMREARPTGAHIGAYGWVEDLRPDPGGRRTRLPAERMRELTAVAPSLGAFAALETQVSTGGHIHAPSMTHAAAAAILRSGFLSRHGENQDRYAVNLSSARVRAARFLLDAVRNGQPLGAVLGYQFERGLHEGHRPLELDKYIEPFRALFPLVANKLTPAEPGEATETVAARNVVDGLALHAAWRKNEIPFGSQGLPPVSGADRSATEAELLLLDRAIDSLADLLTAESVFQIVRGSAVTASATLDSLARGVRPPDPEIARSPRGGSTLLHKLALVIGGDAMQPAGWGAVAHTARSRAEPFLDGWLGTLLGDPAAIRCRVTYSDAVDPAVTHEREVALSELGLRPVDVLAAVTASESTPQTTGAVPATAQVSELDARIAFHVLGEPDAAVDADIEIRYAPFDPALRSFPEVAEVLHAAGALLSSARPLEPRDLLAPDRGGDEATADTLPAEVTNRANQAFVQLDAAIVALDTALAPLDIEPRPPAPNLTPLRNALLQAAAFGTPAAIPQNRKGNRADQLETLLMQAKSVRAELDRRRNEAIAATTPGAKITAIFGAAFKFLPRFIPAAGELDQALNVGPTPPPAPAAVRRWLHGAAQVRPPTRRLRHLTMLARALGVTVPDPHIVQLPHAAVPWAAETFGDDANRPLSGSVSLALLRAVAPDADDPWVGLVIDDWTELIPNRVESTAVAFHYDDPGAEAPQTVLVAVPPGNEQTWSLDTVMAILRETLELAKVRTVDGELLEQLAQVLPATYLAANPRNDTISTIFTTHVMADAVIRST